MNTYNHANFVERLTEKADRETRYDAEVRDLGNDAVAYIKSGVDEDSIYNPQTDEDKKQNERGNYPFYISIDVYFRGHEIGGDSLGNIYSGSVYNGYETYKMYRDEMIAALDVQTMRRNYIKMLQEQIEALSA